MPLFNVEIAKNIGADGVHLRQSDMPCGEAREILGEEKIIGVSVTTPKEAIRAVKEGADYIAANGVFSTDTKKDLQEPLGLEGVTRLKEVTSSPLIAIGGINLSNAAEVIKAGADGLAVVTAITMSDDIPRTCREFLRIVDLSLQARS